MAEAARTVYEVQAAALGMQPGFAYRDEALPSLRPRSKSKHVSTKRQKKEEGRKREAVSTFSSCATLGWLGS